MKAKVAWWLVRFSMWFLLRVFPNDMQSGRFTLLECNILIASETDEFVFTKEFTR